MMNISLSFIHDLLKVFVPEDLSRSLTRSQFIRGQIRTGHKAIRPPWALAERDFTALCSGCSDCRDSCRQRIIEKGRDGLPTVSFRTGECTFCGDCVAACPEGALARHDPLAPPWRLTVDFGKNCLLYNRTICQSCREACPVGAISFRHKPGGTVAPLFNREACTGCGACFSVCPVKALTLSPAGPDRKPADQKGES